MTDREREINRVIDILKRLEPMGDRQYRFSKNERREIAEYIVDNGVRTRTGFTSGVYSPHIKPKQWEK